MKVNDFPVSIIVAICITAAALTAMSARGHDADAPIDLGALKEAAEARFADVDADDDGTLTSAEFEAADIEAGPRQRGGRFAARMRDRRGDGPPFAGRGADRRGDVFTEADTDEDGQLSKDEYDAIPQAMQRLARRAMFARLDDNDDARLSFDEFPSRYARMLALDQNDDGQVTRAEVGREGMRRHGRRGPGFRGRP